MIPKVIHYCWFGRNPLPELAKKCIESWKIFLPDYEIKEWNEDNFDVNIVPYTAEAYKLKKYAFVSDYARFWILYHYGGLYFDTDVEVVKPINDIVDKGAFMGCENEIKIGNEKLRVAPGLALGVEKGNNTYKVILDYYSKEKFEIAATTQTQITVVDITTEILVAKGLQNINDIQQIEDITIYPKSFFCPIDYVSNKCVVTKDTRTIHHYAATWIGNKQKLYFFIARNISPNFASFCSRVFKAIFN